MEYAGKVENSDQHDHPGSTTIVQHDPETGLYSFPCPHCENLVVVHTQEIACHIFRHGYFFQKQGEKIVLTEQIPPHSSKADCDRYVAEGRIIGCGKPFQMYREGDRYNVRKCDYI